MPVPQEHSRQKPVPGRWTTAQRDWGVALWIAFLTACMGTFALFALVDPERLTDAWVLGWQLELRLVYGLGFGFLFVLGVICSRLTIYMIRTGPAPGYARGKTRRPPQIRDPDEANPDLAGEKWQ